MFSFWIRPHSPATFVDIQGFIMINYHDKANVVVLKVAGNMVIHCMVYVPHFYSLNPLPTVQ